MDLKFNSTDEVVCVEVVDLLVVIDVVAVDLELLLLLEMVFAGDSLDPVGVEVIMDDFSLSELGPDSASLFVKNTEGI